MKKNVFKLTVGILLIVCITLAGTSCGAIFEMAEDAIDGIFDGVSILDMLSGNKEEDTATISGMGQCDLYYLDNDGNWQISDGKASLFNEGQWEPGMYETRVFKVENPSEATAYYRLSIGGDFTKLADVIDVYRCDGEVYPENGDLSGYNKLGRLSEINKPSDKVNIKEYQTTDGSNKEDVVIKYEANISGDVVTRFEGDMNGIYVSPTNPGASVILGGTIALETLNPGETKYFTVVLKMDETAGNEYQGLELGQVGASIITINYVFSANPNDGNVEFETKYYVTTGEGFYYKPIE